MFRSESEFVHWLRSRAPSRGRGLRLGIGDDAALVEMARGQELILTADMSIEDVHFTRHLHPAYSIGHRAMARSLSDVAAMGGTPRFALVSLAISGRTTHKWIEGVYEGLSTLAERYDVAVIGGDTAAVSGKTMIDVFLLGEVPRGRALRRSGAQPGDQIFVSGRLGLSALGLWWLRSEAGLPHRRKGTLWRALTRSTTHEAVRAHLYPEPRCALGRALSTRRLASATIDLSDGLSTDLSRLCEASGVGARVWLDRIPVPEISKYPRAALLRLALHGGEDYQLLFTVAPGKASQIPSRLAGASVYRIGEIRRAKELILVRLNGTQQPLRPAGYNHFRKGRPWSVVRGPSVVKARRQRI